MPKDGISIYFTIQGGVKSFSEIIRHTVVSMIQYHLIGICSCVTGGSTRWGSLRTAFAS